MKRRNGMLDIAKLFFAVALLLNHANSIMVNPKVLIMCHGYLTVEFFFIISGYFMIKSINWKKLGGGG